MTDISNHTQTLSAIAHPFYERGGITIYHGDAREILPLVSADVLVTDPPYGIELGADGQGSDLLRHDHYSSYDDTYENYLEVVVPVITAALWMTHRGAVFTGPHLWELPKADAIGGIYCPAAVASHRWGFKTFLPILLYGTNPRAGKGRHSIVLHSTEAAEKNGHPCPKPLGWLRWLVSFASLEAETILNPFMGSGTTLRAAKDLGRRAIGIEIEERYCEIAAKRLSQEVLDFGGPP